MRLQTQLQQRSLRLLSVQAHKYKDSREQFEMRTHKRLIDVLRPTKETTAALENLELPAGVNIVMEIK